MADIYFSIRAKHVLEKLKIKTTKDFHKLTIEKLIRTRGIGTKTINEIISTAKEYGIIIH